MVAIVAANASDSTDDDWRAELSAERAEMLVESTTTVSAPAVTDDGLLYAAWRLIVGQHWDAALSASEDDIDDLNDATCSLAATVDGDADDFLTGLSVIAEQNPDEIPTRAVGAAAQAAVAMECPQHQLMIDEILESR